MLWWCFFGGFVGDEGVVVDLVFEEVFVGEVFVGFVDGFV